MLRCVLSSSLVPPDTCFPNLALLGFPWAGHGAKAAPSCRTGLMLSSRGALTVEPWMANARMTVEALREQVARIEAEVGTQVSRLDAEIGTTTEANSTLSTQVTDAVLRLDSQRDSMEAREKAVEERMGSFHDRMQAMTEEFEERIRSLEGEIVLLKRAVVQGTPSAADPPPAKVQVPEPKTFGGARNTKDLENFLWDMEQYLSECNKDSYILRSPKQEGLLSKKDS